PGLGLFGHLLAALHPDRRTPAELAVLLFYADVIVCFARRRILVGIGEPHLGAAARRCINDAIALDHLDPRDRACARHVHLERSDRALKTLAHEMTGHAHIE